MHHDAPVQPNLPPEAGSLLPPRRPAYSRTAHRARSHESAHAEEIAPPAAIPQHRLIPRNNAELIDSQPAFDALIQELRQAGQFAYDSEFIGELTYRPKLCLIQVASASRVSLIDPLVDLDLAPFWELICDPSVEKIVHAGEQDVEPVIRHIGKAPANLFDTQIAAGFIGLPYPVALGKLVHEITGAKIGKGLTFTHWDQRPLSSMQLRYAADDVRYLPALREAIGQKLDALGHSVWSREECAAMCEPSRYQFDPEHQFLRIRGASSLSPEGMAILRALTIWRDEAAQLDDLPPRSFLKDEILLELARRPVKSIEKLARVRGLPRPIEAQHGERIVQATIAALALPAAQMPQQRNHEPSPAERFRAESLWAAAQAICAGQSIDTAVVASRAEIGELERRLEANEPLEDLRLMAGWRHQALGEPLLQLRRGQKAFQLNWNESLHIKSTGTGGISA